MVRLYPYAVGLLAIAAMLTITNTDARALSRETPLQTAQRIEALTAGGLFNPPSLIDGSTAQREARPR
jgi:hypothetical protein